MPRLFANNATSTLAAAIVAADTSLTLATGEGALFPSPSGGDFFDLTLTQDGNETSWEVVKCTARSGDVLTVERGVYGFTAADWASGSMAELRIHKDALDDLSNLGKHVIGYWPAAAIKPRTTNPCADLGWGETATNKINYGYLAFDAGANEYAYFSFRAPKSLDETVGFTAVLTVAEANGASTHNSAWTIQALALSTTDALDAALSTAVQVNITTASGTQVLSAESSTITPAGTWAAGDMIYVQIGRYATDATNDTLNVDAHLIGVTLYATYDAGVEP